MRLLADGMLGSLAKWMRYLGHDVVYLGPAPEDDELLRLALAERRLLLTRDRELAARVKKRGGEAVFIASLELDPQLEQAVGVAGIDEDLVLARCGECNGLLRDATLEEAAGAVPEGVLSRVREFWKCDGCGRFYWEGSHYAAIERRIGGLRGRARGVAAEKAAGSPADARQ